MLVGESGVVGRQNRSTLFNNLIMLIGQIMGATVFRGLVSAGGQVQPFGGGKPSWIATSTTSGRKKYFVKWFHSKCPITDKKRRLIIQAALWKISVFRRPTTVL